MGKTNESESRTASIVDKAIKTQQESALKNNVELRPSIHKDASFVADPDGTTDGIKQQPPEPLAG
ncbi:MAG: hypothetical protein K2Z81_15610 [Cyanobacteria bacterium]|nr:hypothetical protein [Cyanobacteriota bacterium]